MFSNLEAAADLLQHVASAFHYQIVPCCSLFSIKFNIIFYTC